MIRIFTFITMTAILLSLIGCGGGVTETEPTVDPAENTGANSSTVEPTVPAELPEDRASAFPLDPPENAPLDNTPSEPAAAETTPAAAGVGKKGQGYGGGLVSEPARQYFRIRERVVFQVQIPQALNAYKAIHGKPPQTHDEFMAAIIKENDIQLPDLQPGKKYLFDSEKGELMIQSGG